MHITKRKKKDGTISYRIKVCCGYDNNGKQIIDSMTYVPEKGLTKKQAEREVLKQGILFEERCEQKEHKRLKITFEELSEEWLNLVTKTKELKTSTIVRLKTLRPRTYQALGKIQVEKITYKMIQDFILTLSDEGQNKTTGKGLSQKTQKHYVTFISDVMRYAKKRGIIEHNPCCEVSTVKTESSEKDIYSLIEMQELLQRLRNSAPIKYCTFFHILAFSGVRRGEIMGLEYSDIDFNSGIISINKTSNYQTSETGIYTDTTKNESSNRLLYLQPVVIEMIKALKKDQYEQRKGCGDQWKETDRLFVQWNGLPMHPNTPYTWLRRFCEREGLPFKGIHSFRHFVATEAYANGVRTKEISSILGHSQISTTLNIYTHMRDKANVNALNSIANALKIS